MEKILIIGANGKTGQHIVELLKNIDRYQVSAMIRKEHQKQNFDNDHIKFVIGDLEEDFEHAFKNIDKVVFAAGSGGSTGDDKTLAVDRDGAKKAVDYSVKHNLKKFVMLSSMGTDQPEKVEGLEVYLKAKKAADDYLKSKDLDYSILQPGMLTDDEPKHKIQIAESLSAGKISRKDVAYVLVKSLTDKICKNKTMAFVSGDKDVDEVLETY
ncbi:SDR family oxidoreductase [Psychroflexus planctonicus]|uniref:Sugar epimerase YhfK n=1 Tax=Psychroflexus planctonicus TaxID=1526575 RepID=A0ABQ1SK28_9FLAO|nr:SDR family oxidoreductase [Psychroflexus planctonicus]GGE42592.1 putative sugar epimerase YhfK [Psychroflexus planctonicus]